MKLPNIKKILREDLKGAEAWVSGLIDPLNNFMEQVYQALNKNITFSENIAANIRELTVKTSSTYPTMDRIEFLTGLRVRSTGLILLQAYEKATYVPVAGPVYVAWTEEDGNILIYNITGLSASKIYIVRVLVI